MTASGTNTSNLGFLTVVREGGGYLGGYLVTNQWGRPLEFRLSTPVQPNRVQQILYAETLEPYVCGELIGKTLVEKTGMLVRAVVTDTLAALELRQKIDVPVVLLTPHPRTSPPQSPGNEHAIRGPHLQFPRDERIPKGEKAEMCLKSHPKFPDDSWIVQELLDRVAEGFDLPEPFLRVREAMAEARKMGVTSRT